ncbi:MAG: M20/M25/M40 family metallo-hydrolase [Desulfosarcinaceae bacterium]
MSRAIDHVRLENNLYKHVSFLSEDIGERHLWRDDTLARAENYIASQFELLGYHPFKQKYTAYQKPVANVIAEKSGQRKDLIVIGAHYDTVPGSPGADDNASAVAGLLEVARLMRDSECRYRYAFAAFANEESPSFGSDYMGSMQYARYLHDQREKVKFMIALEMIGYFNESRSQSYPLRLMRSFYPKSSNFLAVIGDFASHRYVRALCRRIRKENLIPVRSLIAPQQLGGINRSDHSAFWQYGYKAVMITDTSQYRNKNYHRETDTIDTLNFSALADVVVSLHRTLINL